jgi:hypothetical protein
MARPRKTFAHVITGVNAPARAMRPFGPIGGWNPE